MPDYEVLVHLTDSRQGRIRVTDLARLLQWERSRVSHHVTRMERRRLVQRVECAEDGRGAFIVITPQGRAAIEQAAPGHVNTVRRLVFDGLSPEEVGALATIIEKALAQLDDQAEGLP
jgi:DNA-binding MarR family transcriptional regulator